MNYGTKIRTVLGILTTINTILAVTDVTQFGNDKLTLWYKIVSVVINAIIVGINTYYNNDYTPEAAIGTGMTRQLKLEKEAGYVGDIFFTDENFDDSVDEDMGNLNQDEDFSDVELIEAKGGGEENE